MDGCFDVENNQKLSRIWGVYIRNLASSHMQTAQFNEDIGKSLLYQILNNYRIGGVNRPD